MPFFVCYIAQCFFFCKWFCLCAKRNKRSVRCTDTLFSSYAALCTLVTAHHSTHSGRENRCKVEDRLRRQPSCPLKFYAFPFLSPAFSSACVRLRVSLIRITEYGAYTSRTAHTDWFAFGYLPHCAQLQRFTSLPAYFCLLLRHLQGCCSSATG